MPPALAQSARETLVDSGASVSLAYNSSIAAGNLATVEISRYTGATTDALVVGDVTKSAGTATIGTIVLDSSALNTTNGASKFTGGIASAPITGNGSMTWQVSGNAGDAWWINIDELTGVAMAREAQNSAASSSNSNAADSGNASSVGAALFLALLSSNNGGNNSLDEDAAFTLLNEEENGSLHQVGASAYRVVATGTTDSASWALGTSMGWIACVAVYPAAGGGDPDQHNPFVKVFFKAA